MIKKKLTDNAGKDVGKGKAYVLSGREKLGRPLWKSIGRVIERYKYIYIVHASAIPPGINLKNCTS